MAQICGKIRDFCVIFTVFRKNSPIFDTFENPEKFRKKREKTEKIPRFFQKQAQNREKPANSSKNRRKTRFRAPKMRFLE